MAKYKGTHSNDSGRWESKSYAPLTDELMSEWNESNADSIRREIQKEVKTANSRLRRNSESGIENPTLDPQFSTAAGFFSSNTKGENIDQLKKHLQAVRNYLSQGLTRTAQGAAKPVKSRKVQAITQAQAKQYTDDQLRELIKKEGKTANSRIRRLKENGLIDSPIIGDKWRNISGSPFGTENGYFKTGTGGETYEEMQLHLMNILEFLSKDYTIKGIQEARKEFSKKIGVDEETGDIVLGILRDLRQMGYTGTEAYNSTDLVVELVDLGMSHDYIIKQCQRTIEQENTRQARVKQQFQKKAKRFKKR